MNRNSNLNEGFTDHFEQVNKELMNMNNEITKLQQELYQEKTNQKTRHSQLIETLKSSLQIRDASLGALKRLEQYCIDQGLDITGYAIYEVILYLSL